MAMINGSDVDAGSFDNCAIDTLFIDNTMFTCNSASGNIVTLVVVDQGGNTDSCTASVTVLDSVAPIAVCQDVTVQLDANGQASVAASDINNGSSDNCNIDSLSISPSTFDCSHVSVASNQATLTVTDVNGNTASCVAQVTVQDTIPPTAVCQSITVQLDSNGMASIDGADIDNGSSDNCGIDNFNVTPSQFDCQHIGDQTVVLTVTDESGNTSTCMANVNVQDTIAPTAVCQNVTISINETGIATVSVVDVDGGSYDNCDVQDVVISPSDGTGQVANFSCEELNGNSITLIITDVNGNSDSCSSIVTVVDPVPPVAICQDITVYLDANGNATISGTDIDGGSTDNCAIVSLNANPNSFTCDDIGTNSVVLTVTDQSGNDSTCTANVKRC